MTQTIHTVVLLGALTALLPYANAQTDLSEAAMHGKVLYESRCTACHAVEANRIGPAHRGVFGRKAGSLPDFHYSTALKNSGIVWNEETLNQWLTDPEEFVPGQRMSISVENPKDRADLIAYLKTLKPLK